TPNEEAALGRQIQLALRVEPNLDVSRVQPGEAREIINRGLRARDRLTVANLRLINFAIRHIARSAKSLDPWDLYQEGTIGLMRAVEKFDPELGLKFSTYALWWIRQAIFRGLDDKDRTIRVPVHRLASIRRMRYVTRQLAQERGREPTVREIAEAMDWPLEKTLFIQRLAQLDCISLDAPIGEDGESTVADTIMSHAPS